MEIKDELNENINFSHFLELTDIMSRDTSHVKLDTPESLNDPDISGENMLIHRFHVNGEEFDVYMQLVTNNNEFSGPRNILLMSGIKIEKANEILSNIYDVSLRGPNSFRLTHRVEGATEIYANMILGLRKLDEEKRPNGIKFFSMQSQMIKMYDKFLSRFSDLELFDHSSGLYLRKPIINMILKLATNVEFLQQHLRDSGESHQSTLSKSIESKDMFRQIAFNKVDLTNKIMYLKDLDSPIIVTSPDLSTRYANIIYKANIVGETYWYMGDFSKIKPNQMQAVEAFMSEISKDPRFKKYANAQVYTGWWPNEF